MTALSETALVAVGTALAHPHRIRILIALQRRGASHVSQLARHIAISRPLLHMHLKRLEAAGLVSSRLDHSTDGKSLHVFAISDFAVTLTPETIAASAPR